MNTMSAVIGGPIEFQTANLNQSRRIFKNKVIATSFTSVFTTCLGINVPSQPFIDKV